MGTVEKLAEIAKSRGNPALCVTNHGTIGQYARQYFSCRDEGIKPIFGCEVYVNNFRDEVKEIIEKIKILKEENKKIKNDKDPVSIKNLKKIVKLDSRLEKIKPNNHLILLAKNKTGLDNLIKITNDGWKNGFYSRPRVTMDFVMENKEGLIISTACIAGEIPQTLIKEGYEEAKELLLEWKKVFGKSNLFVEITMIDFKQQVKITKELIRLAKECKLKWIVTTDSHYIEPEDSETHDILLMINSGKTVNDLQKNPEEVWQFESKDLWYKDYKGMYRTWKKHYRKVMSKEDFHSAIDNVMDIVERIEEFDLDTSVKLPMIYETPEEGFRELKRLCKKGWKRREIENEDNIPDYIERRDFELGVIEQMEYADFFLIMEDMLSWARMEKIPVGPSRGSAAGSLVSYLLGITDIDPLKHNLLFERFINIDRKDVPDIDVDFSPERRGEVRNYLREKYGHEYTMFIGSYGTFGTKAVIGDVSRVLCIPLGEVFRVTTKMAGGVDEDHTSWEDLRKFYPDLDNFFDKYPEAFNLCERLRGQIKNLSKHAAGVVICSQNVYNSMPIHTIDGVEVTALQIGLNRKYKELEELGFPKFDLLGLNNLDVIYDCVRLIEENHGKKIDLLKIPLNDKKALRLGNKKDTLGVFQLETHLMRQIIDTIGINTFNDISAIVAIARPGPLNAKVHEFYADRKSGEEKFKIPECWENDLRSSFGLIIYQEQVMNMVQRIGFSQAESNKFRKFVSKKPLPDEPLYKDFLAYKKRFIKGAVMSGISKTEAKKYWQDIEFFSKYSFNLSHSVAYALIAYWELYLKALYPVEFHCALLMNTKRGVTGKGKKERNKFEEYISSTRDRDIKVLPIDINKTSANFNIEKGNIRAGYTFIKDIGDKSPEELETNYPFKSINKFFKSKINWSVLNKSKMTALIKVGAFDSIYKNRRKLLAIYETWQEVKKTKTKSKEFIERYDKKTLIESIIYHYDNKVKLNDFTALEKLMMEKEYLGFYFSGHPIDKYKKVIEKNGMRYCREFRKKPKSNDKVVGMVSSIRVITTKYGENMAFMDIEDGIDKVNIALWPEYYGQYKKILKEGNLIVIKLKKSNRPDSFEIAGQDGRKQIMLLSEFS